MPASYLCSYNQSLQRKSQYSQFSTSGLRLAPEEFSGGIKALLKDTLMAVVQEGSTSQTANVPSSKSLSVEKATFSFSNFWSLQFPLKSFSVTMSSICSVFLFPHLRMLTLAEIPKPKIPSFYGFTITWIQNFLCALYIIQWNECKSIAVMKIRGMLCKLDAVHS